MSFLSRLRAFRRHQSLRLESGEQQWWIWLPPADETLTIAGFGDVAMLTTLVFDLPAEREVLALLDEQRRVTALLLDPPPEIGLLVGMAELPGVEAPFCQTLSVMIMPSVCTCPPTAEERHGYHALRRAHMAQGLLLLDVVLTDGDTVRSLAIGCDPDPVWFDEFDPLPGGPSVAGLPDDTADAA
jgi:hypothetical protein